MKKHISKLLGLALAFSCTSSALAVSVTFRVDMSVQIQMGVFDPLDDLVSVPANFNSWDESAFYLTNSVTDTNVWQGTVDLDAGSWPNYKFLMTIFGGGFIWESGDDRWFQVPSTNYILPVVYFDDVSEPIYNHAPVTFQVDMSVQMADGSFDPGADTVSVSGSWDNWPEPGHLLSQSLADTNVWEGTFEVTNNVGSTVQYKFVETIFGVGFVWEADGVGPGGAQNRAFVMTNEAQTLPVVYFNNQTNPLVSAPVTFAVNMSVQIAEGNFDPDLGTVEVSGSWDDWATNTWILTNSVTDTNVWQGTLEITNALGSVVEYLFIRDAIWETVDNRTFIMTNVAQTLDAVYFNDQTNASVPIPMTFSVNMGVAMARGTFNPGGGDYVEARGSFLTDGQDWLGGFTLTNEPGGSTVYSGTIIDTNWVGGTMLYKFVINDLTGQTNLTWEDNITDRTYPITDTNAVTLPTVFFDNIATLGTLTNTPLSATNAELSWDGGTLIRVQSSTNLTGPWQNIGGTEGQSSATVPVGPDQTYFRLTGP